MQFSSSYEFVQNPRLVCHLSKYFRTVDNLSALLRSDVYLNGLFFEEGTVDSFISSVDV